MSKLSYLIDTGAEVSVLPPRSEDRDRSPIINRQLQTANGTAIRTFGQRSEMRMLRWMCKVTKLDKIRNERIRGTTKVGEITKKVQERRLKWYGHVMRREEHYAGRRAIVMKVQGIRKRGRPKRRWLDKVKDDIKEKGLSADDVYGRATWRRMSSYIEPT